MANTDTYNIVKPAYTDEIATDLTGIANGFQLLDDEVSEVVNFSVATYDADLNPIDVRYTRVSDGTLKRKAVASNPNSAGKYQTVTITVYGTDGTTIKYTRVVTLTYDNYGNVTGRTVA